jgi:hypothetical protein
MNHNKVSLFGTALQTNLFIYLASVAGGINDGSVIRNCLILIINFMISVVLTSYLWVLLKKKYEKEYFTMSLEEMEQRWKSLIDLSFEEYQKTLQNTLIKMREELTQNEQNIMGLQIIAGKEMFFYPHFAKGLVYSSRLLKPASEVMKEKVHYLTENHYPAQSILFSWVMKKPGSSKLN